MNFFMEIKTVSLKNFFHLSFCLKYLSSVKMILFVFGTAENIFCPFNVLTNNNPSLGLSLVYKTVTKLTDAKDKGRSIWQKYRFF